MTDRDKFVMAMRVLSGLQKRLDAPDIEALGLQQHEDTPFDHLYTGESDPAWHGTCSGGAAKGSPLRVHPDEVKECCMAILAAAVEKCGAFAAKKRVRSK